MTATSERRGEKALKHLAKIADRSVNLRTMPCRGVFGHAATVFSLPVWLLHTGCPRRASSTMWCAQMHTDVCAPSHPSPLSSARARLAGNISLISPPSFALRTSFASGVWCGREQAPELWSSGQLDVLQWLYKLRSRGSTGSHASTAFRKTVRLQNDKSVAPQPCQWCWRRRRQ